MQSPDLSQEQTQLMSSDTVGIDAPPKAPSAHSFSPFMVVLFISVNLIVLGGLQALVFLGFRHVPLLNNMAVYISTSVLTISSIVCVFLKFRIGGPITTFIAWVNSIWMGFMPLIALVYTVAMPITWVTNQILNSSLNSGFTISPTTVINGCNVLLTGFLMVSIVLAHLPKVVHHVIPAAVEHPVKMVFMADLHLPYPPSGFVRRAFRIARSLNPAAILLAGDLTDNNLSDFLTHIADLQPLSAPGPDGQAPKVFAVTGNHDIYPSREHATFKAALLQQGVRLLENEAVPLPAVGITVAGVHDRGHPRHSMEDTTAAMSRSSFPVVAIAHQPLVTDMMALTAAGARMVVCGHTHAGQLPPFSWFVPLQFGMIHGRYPAGRGEVAVTSGLGYWGPPMRLGSRSEIVELLFVPEK